MTGKKDKKMTELLSKIYKVQNIEKLALAGLGGEGGTLVPLFRYAKIKGNILFFVFKHPSARLEFGYKKESIKTTLRTYYKANIDTMKQHNITFGDIGVAVITEKIAIKNEKSDGNTFAEPALGEFVNYCKDEGLRAMFEGIRSMIKRNQR